jgi:hypothetical protein
MRDMIDVLITHVHLLPDLLAVRRLSREIYSWSRGVPHRRLVSILHRFFQESLDHFLTVMHQTGTIITGICALNMLLGLLYESSSSDMNLIVQIHCDGCISSEGSRICHCGRTDRTTFIGSPIGFSFRPLSKIASLCFFEPSRCDRPNKSHRMQRR